MKPKDMTSAQYIALLEKKLEVYEKLQQRTGWKDLANSTIFAESMRWTNSSMFSAGANWAQRRLKELNG
jgi:hypothetical protein